MNWIPIDDELLCNNTCMLLCDSRGYITIGFLDDHDNTLRDEIGNEIYDVTHFIYLNDIPRPVEPRITNDDCVPKLLKKQKNG